MILRFVITLLTSLMSSTTATVRVTNVSFSVTPHDIQEFFSFSGLIDYIEIRSVNERSQIAFVTFKDFKGAETAVLLSGATIVDQSVDIALQPDYVLPSIAFEDLENNADADDDARSQSESTSWAVEKAEDVVTTMLAKGYILGQDAMNKAKDFDERHQVISTATAQVATLDQRIGLSEKVSIGATIVNDKMKDMDHKYEVSKKTRSALATAEQTVSTAGSAVMKNRYILTGTSWVLGAFSRVTKAAGEVGQKTMEKVSEEQQQRENYDNALTEAANADTDDDKLPQKPLIQSPKGLIL